MDNINIDDIINKYDKIFIQGVDGESYDRYAISIDNVKAAIKEIIEAVIDKCAVEAESKDVKVPACDDHTPYRGACVSCGRYDNPDVIISSEVDKHSILNIKTQINYGI